MEDVRLLIFVFRGSLPKAFHVGPGYMQVNFAGTFRYIAGGGARVVLSSMSSTFGGKAVIGSHLTVWQGNTLRLRWLATSVDLPQQGIPRCVKRRHSRRDVPHIRCFRRVQSSRYLERLAVHVEFINSMFPLDFCHEDGMAVVRLTLLRHSNFNLSKWLYPPYLLHFCGVSF